MKESKVILITGASAGMGKETAKDLLKLGHTVYCAARSVSKMDDLKELGGKVVKLDISNEEDIEVVVNQIINEAGRVDVLWNNAGFGLFGSVEETTLEDARYQFDVNIFGLARLTQLIIPHMRNEQSGLIINTSSMGGKMYTPLGAWYHATKHALEGWSDCLRFELAQFGIKVVILEPGAIKTEFGDVMTAPMLKRSGNGPYKGIARPLAKLSEQSMSKNNSASPASLISKTVLKIIKSKNPKRRYLVGKYAKPLVFIRKWFGDALFDRLLKLMLR